MRRSGEEMDPFDDLDVAPDTSKMESLMSQLQPESSCSVTEFICGDDDLAVCAELDNEEWEEQLSIKDRSHCPNGVRFRGVPAQVQRNTVALSSFVCCRSALAIHICK